MLSPVPIPGLFVTATDTGVGKTIVAAAIADHFHRRGLRVGVFKPVATGSASEPDGSLSSEDADMLGAVIGNRFTSAQINPVRFAEPLAPAIAARRAGQGVDWSLIGRSLATICADSDVIVVEGAGGVCVPIDDRHAVLDVIRWLRLPTLCVSRASLGTINHTTLTLEVLRAARVEVAGVVVNRYDASTAGIAEQTGVAEIERYASVPVRCVVPESYFDGYRIPDAICAAIDTVEWSNLARLGRGRPGGRA